MAACLVAGQELLTSLKSQPLQSSPGLLGSLPWESRHNYQCDASPVCAPLLAAQSRECELQCKTLKPSSTLQAAFDQLIACRSKAVT